MSFRDTLKHGKNYFGASVATKALSLVSLPVLTKVLGVSPYDYGIIALFSTYAGIFIYIITLNSFSAVGRYYYEERDDFKQFFGTTINISVILMIVLGCMCLLLTKPISAYLDLSPYLYSLLFLSIIFSVGSSIFSQVMQVRERSSLLAKYSILTAYIGFGITVVMTMLNPNHKYLGSIYSQLIIGGASLLYFVKVLKPYYSFSLKREHLRYIFGYGLPLIPYFLSGVILGQFDRVMIAKYTNIEDAGLYSFAYNIGFLLSLVTSALFAAWMPKYYPLMNAKNYGEHDRQVNLMHRLILVATLIFIFFGKEMGMLLGSKSFYSSLNLVPPVVMGYLFFAYFYFYGWTIAYSKRNIWNAVIVGIAGVVNIGLNMIFIPYYGYEAAAYTTMVSYMIMAFVGWIVSRYVIKLHSFSPRKIIKPFLLLLVFIVPFYILNVIVNPWIEIPIKGVLFIIFTIIIFKEHSMPIIKSFLICIKSRFTN